MASVGVYVIGDRDRLRSSTLGEALAHSPWPLRCVAPVFVDLEAQSQFVDNQTAELIFGRTLTAGEVGCAIAHRSVYAEAAAENVDFAVVFEDDAYLPPDIWQRLERVLPCDLLSGASVLSLHAGDHGRGRQVKCGSEKVVRLRIPPTHAVAYVISRQAIRCALSAPMAVVSPADWPPWSVSVDFFLLNDFGIDQSGVSVIGARPGNASGLRSFGRLLKVIGPRALLAARVYFPSTGAYLKWAVIAPASKLARRQRRRAQSSWRGFGE